MLRFAHDSQKGICGRLPLKLATIRNNYMSVNSLVQTSLTKKLPTSGIFAKYLMRKQVCLDKLSNRNKFTNIHTVQLMKSHSVFLYDLFK